MKTLREMMDLIESAQKVSPELRTWGNRDTGEIHYSIDGVEVDKDRYYQAWRADQQAKGNPDIKEDEDERIEFLANAFADLYWGGRVGMTSATEKVKMANQIIQAIKDGKLSVEELKQDISDLEQGVTEDQATAKMGLMSAVGSNDNNPADQRRAMAQRAVEQLAS
jgi:hypothetical protein